MAYPIHITPQCRYGHGPLQKDVMERAPDGSERMLAIPSFILNKRLGHPIPDNGGFSIKPYVCEKCGYMEFFDEGK